MLCLACSNKLQWLKRLCLLWLDLKRCTKRGGTSSCGSFLVGFSGEL